MSAKDTKKGSLTPRLRFPEFRDAGEWEMKQLGACLDYQQPTPYLVSGTNYNSSFVTPVLTAGKTFVLGYTNEKDGIFREGLPVIIFDDFTTSTQFVDFPFKAKSSAMKILQAKKSANIKFMYEVLQKISYYTDTHERHWISKFAPMPVKIPRLREQQKIADCLSSLDERIVSETDKLDALKTHKKGLLKQLFPAEGETTPKVRFPEFRDAGEWEELPLSELMSSLDAGVSVNAGDRPAGSEEVGVLKTSAVTNGIFEPQENKVVLDAAEMKRMKEPVLRDTIIISRMNTPALVGANAYVETSLQNIFLPDRLWAAKPKPGTSMRFVAFILGSSQGRAALSQSAKGSSGSMKNITKPDVLAFLVMTPPPPEQQRIADCLSSLDELISAQTQKIELLKAHKKGLMQQLFPVPEEAHA